MAPHWGFLRRFSRRSRPRASVARSTGGPPALAALCTASGDGPSAMPWLRHRSRARCDCRQVTPARGCASATSRHDGGFFSGGSRCEEWVVQPGSGACARRRGDAVARGSRAGAPRGCRPLRVQRPRSQRPRRPDCSVPGAAPCPGAAARFHRGAAAPVRRRVRTVSFDPNAMLAVGGETQRGGAMPLGCLGP